MNETAASERVRGHSLSKSFRAERGILALRTEGPAARDLSGMTREIAAEWDASADGITLSDDGTTIYTTAQELGQHPLFSVSIEGGNVSQVVGGGSVAGL